MQRPDFPQIIDNSLINTFRSCPRKAFLEYFEHYKPGQQSVHLHAGAAFAHGCEVARRAFYDKGLDHDAALGKGVLALWSSYGDYEPPEDSAKHPLRMAEALVYFFDSWPFATDHAKPMLKPDGSSAVEFSFAEPLDILHPESHEPLIYAGRADMVVTLAQGIFIEDDKTASALGAAWHQQWDLRAQFTGYVWAARQMDLEVTGVLIRGVAILKTEFKHAEEISFRPKWEVERWHEQTLRDIRRMIAAWNEGYFDYNLGDACSSFGGCMFKNVCKSNDPDTWLSSYFERRVWNPITRLETALEPA